MQEENREAFEEMEDREKKNKGETLSSMCKRFHHEVMSGDSKVKKDLNEKATEHSS